MGNNFPFSEFRDEYIINNLFLRRGLYYLYSSSNLYSSLLVSELIHSVFRGNSFMNYYKYKPFSLLHIGDFAPEVMNYIIEECYYKNNTRWLHLYYTNNKYLFSMKNVEKIIEQFSKNSIIYNSNIKYNNKIVFINMKNIINFNVNKNSYKNMKILSSFCKEMCNKYNVTIILINNNPLCEDVEKWFDGILKILHKPKSNYILDINSDSTVLKRKGKRLIIEKEI